MLLAAKLALAPVLRHQGRAVRRTALRLPEPAGPRQGVAGEGELRLRLLVVGDSSAAGVGLQHQSQALALPLAELLSRRLDGAVAWQLLAQTGLDTRGAQALVARSELSMADVVVIVLGVNDATSQQAARAFVGESARLWAQLQQSTGARWAVVCGLPPMELLTAMPQPLRWYLGRYAAGLDAALRDWAAGEGLGFCSLRWAADPSLLAPDGFHPGAALYPPWAQRLAEMILARPDRLAPPFGRHGRRLPRASRCVGAEPGAPSVRPELVEGLDRAEGRSSTAVRAEPVEALHHPQRAEG